MIIYLSHYFIYRLVLLNLKHVLVEEIKKPDPIAAKKYYDVANKMLGEGLKDDAAAYLTKSIAADPTYKQALVLRGHVLVQLGKYEEANKDYDACLKEFKKSDRKLVKFEEDMLQQAKDGYALTDRVGTAFREAQEKLLNAAGAVTDKRSADLLREAAAKVREVMEKKTETKIEAKKEEKKIDPIIGKWKWFHGTATFNNNNTCYWIGNGNERNAGKWENNKGRYIIKWEVSPSTNEMIINNSGTIMNWATEVNNPPSIKIQ